MLDGLFLSPSLVERSLDLVAYQFGLLEMLELYRYRGIIYTCFLIRKRWEPYHRVITYFKFSIDIKLTSYQEGVCDIYSEDTHYIFIIEYIFLK